jgi:hypothetical protein
VLLWFFNNGPKKKTTGQASIPEASSVVQKTSYCVIAITRHPFYYLERGVSTLQLTAAVDSVDSKS